MSPRTATLRPVVLGQVLERRSHRDRVRVVGVVDQQAAAGERDSSPRQRESSTSTLPVGKRRPSASYREERRDGVQRLVARGERELELEPLAAEREDDAAPAVDALERLDVLRAEPMDLDVVAARNGSRSGSSGRRRCRLRQRGDDLGLGLRDLLSTVPSSSRCTGPMLVITPTSGRAIAHSSAIWPRPRMPISQTTTSVSSRSASASAGGRSRCCARPSAATVVACGRHIAARMSFVDVLPVEPVMPTTRAELRARTALPSAASAENASSGTSVAAAPARTRAAGSPRPPRPRRRGRPPRCVASRPGRRSPPRPRARGRAGRDRGRRPRRARAGSLRAAPRLLRASRATSRSSKGTVRSRNC